MTRFALALASLLAAGCGSESGEMPGEPDAGSEAADAQVHRDAAVEPDGGTSAPRDAGFLDPATLLQGTETIGGVQIFIHLRGTLTSTMPPVVLLSTGPSVGNEYLVEPMDFLLGPGGATAPDRLLVLFDLRATGQS